MCSSVIRGRTPWRLPGVGDFRASRREHPRGAWRRFLSRGRSDSRGLTASMFPGPLTHRVRAKLCSFAPRLLRWPGRAADVSQARVNCRQKAHTHANPLAHSESPSKG